MDIFDAVANKILTGARQSQAAIALAKELRKSLTDFGGAENTAENRHKVARSGVDIIRRFATNILPVVGEPPSEVQDVIIDNKEKKEDEGDSTSQSDATDADVDKRETEREEDDSVEQVARRASDEATQKILYLTELIGQGYSFEEAQDMVNQKFEVISKLIEVGLSRKDASNWADLRFSLVNKLIKEKVPAKEALIRAEQEFSLARAKRLATNKEAVVEFKPGQKVIVDTRPVAGKRIGNVTFTSCRLQGRIKSFDVKTKAAVVSTLLGDMEFPAVVRSGDKDIALVRLAPIKPLRSLRILGEDDKKNEDTSGGTEDKSDEKSKDTAEEAAGKDKNKSEARSYKPALQIRRRPIAQDKPEVSQNGDDLLGGTNKDKMPDASQEGALGGGNKEPNPDISQEGDTSKSPGAEPSHEDKPADQQVSVGNEDTLRNPVIGKTRADRIRALRNIVARRNPKRAGGEIVVSYGDDQISVMFEKDYGGPGKDYRVYDRKYNEYTYFPSEAEAVAFASALAQEDGLTKDARRKVELRVAARANAQLSRDARLQRLQTKTASVITENAALKNKTRQLEAEKLADLSIKKGLLDPKKRQDEIRYLSASNESDWKAAKRLIESAPDYKQPADQTLQSRRVLQARRQLGEGHGLLPKLPSIAPNRAGGFLDSGTMFDEKHN